MKNLKDFILESKKSQEEYFSEMLLCDKNSALVKFIVDFINKPNTKFTAWGNHSELRSIAEALDIDNGWVKKFKNTPDIEDMIEGSFEVKEVKNLSGTDFTKCSVAKNDYLVGIEAIIEVSGEGEYDFLVVFELD